MSRGHQTAQTCIATTVDPDDLQHVARREFNRARSNRAPSIYVQHLHRSLVSPSTKLHTEIDYREFDNIEAFTKTFLKQAMTL